MKIPKLQKTHVFLCVIFDFILIKGVIKRKDGYIFH